MTDKNSITAKPQWHSKASIFTTRKHQWPNLKDWLIPLLTWLGAGGCVCERQPSLFNSARCRGESVMSFKLPCYASPCRCFASFQVQAYFQEEARRYKTLIASSGVTLPSGADFCTWSVIYFKQVDFCLFFLKLFRALEANIRKTLHWLK